MNPQKKSQLPSAPPLRSSSHSIPKFKPSFNSSIRCKPMITFIEKQQSNKSNISKQEYIKKLQQQLQKKLKIKNQQLLQNLYQSCPTQQKGLKKLKNKFNPNHKIDTPKFNNDLKVSKKLSERIQIPNHFDTKTTAIQQLSQEDSTPLKTHKSPLSYQQQPQISPLLTSTIQKQPKQLILPKYSNVSTTKKQSLFKQKISQTQKYFELVKNQRTNKLSKKNYQSFSLIQKIKSNEAIKQKQQIHKFNQKISKFQKFITHQQKCLTAANKILQRQRIQQTQDKSQLITSNIKIIKNPHKRSKTQAYEQFPEQLGASQNYPNNPPTQKPTSNAQTDFQLTHQKIHLNPNKNIINSTKLKQLQFTKTATKKIDQPHHQVLAI